MLQKIAIGLIAALLVASSHVAAQSSSSQPAPGLMPRGSASLPGMYFAGDRDTGFYLQSADNMAMATAGVRRLNVDAAGITMQNGIALQWRDSASSARRVLVADASNIIQIGDVDNNFATPTDVYMKAGARLLLYTANAERARFAADGTLSVGTSADVAGALNVNGAIFHNATQAYWLKQVTTITSGSGTYTVPAGVRALKVRLVGGGGGGGEARADAPSGFALAAGGPGQGGFYVEAWMTGLAASYSYGVGAAGTGGVPAGAASTAGGDTTFATFTAKGGSRGTGSFNVTSNTSDTQRHNDEVAVSANAGAYINAPGARGSPPIFDFELDASPRFTVLRCGVGGAGPFGGAEYEASTVLTAQGQSTCNSGITNGPGQGGAGAIAWDSDSTENNASGDDGAAGLIIIEEYF